MVLLKWSVLQFLIKLYNFLHTNLTSSTVTMLTDGKYHLTHLSGPLQKLKYFRPHNSDGVC